MENRKGNEIFLGVVGVATLLVAIIGATFAYFSASAQSGNEAITVQSTVLNLGYSDVTDELSTNLIPASNDIALYAGTNETWISGGEISEGYYGQGLCKDDNKNEVCGIYTFTIGNPNFTTAMNISGEIVSTKNEFKNIWFAIYDEENKQVVAPTKFEETGKSVKLTNLNQQLVGSSLDTGKTPEKDADSFDSEDPTTYTRVDATGAEITDDKVKIAANRRTYKVVIWVQETDEDQTEDDSGKILTAAIKFSTGSGSGVTGVIAAADAS